MPGRSAPAKRAYHHGDLRRALLDQALALAAERGPAALTLREAARRAGVTEAAPYRHFRSKDALVAALAEEGFGALLERTRRALARAAERVRRGGCPRWASPTCASRATGPRTSA